MGITRIGELLRLPRAGISRRLSPAAVLDLDIALARQAAPRRAFVPRVRFRERCDFETEIETVVYLQKALEPLIERCAQFLRERQAGVQSLELGLRHRVIPVTRVRLGLATITSERRRLTDVLDEKLNRLELAAPVRGMELKSGSLQPLPAGSLDAFAGMGGGRGMRAGGVCAGNTAPQLVERLRARLGEQAVYGVVSVPEHRPEAAWRRVHELRLTPATRAGERAGGMRVSEMPRPVWCFSSGRPSVGICTVCSRETAMYAELHALTNFSFLRGASQPEELVLQATRLRYSALAITDECSLAGVVRAHIAAKQHGLPLIIGAEFTCVDDLKLVALATDRASYGALSRVISRARRSTVKGRYALKRDDFTNSLDGCLIIWLPRSGRVSLPQHGTCIGAAVALCRTCCRRSA